MPSKGKSVTINDVAEAAGVSKSIVSYALNGRPEVNENTRERVLKVARDLGWTPSLRGRSLSSSRAYAVGLVFQRPPEVLATDQYFTGFMAGAQSVLEKRHYSLVTEIVRDSDEEIAAYERLGRERVDGFFLVDFHDADRRAEVIRRHGLSAVSLGGSAVSPGSPLMHSDSGPAIDAVVEQLTSLGHTRIAQVAGPQTLVSSRARRVWYQEALAARGIDADLWFEGDYTLASGYEQTRLLLARAPQTTAIIYSNDLMAMAGMKRAVEDGRRVPDDLSVIGWDGLELSRYLQPSLSTVLTHPFTDGETAARLLLDRIGGTDFDEVVQTENPRFLPSASSGPAPR